MTTVNILRAATARLRAAKPTPPIARSGRIVLTLLIMLLTTATAWAEVGDVVDSGTCGGNLTWTLTENEDDAVEWANGTTGHTALTLTITGTGAMDNFTYSTRPWFSDKQSVTRLVLPEGLTTVGDYAFDSFFNVKSVTLPAAVTSIGASALYGIGGKTSGCTFTAAEGSQLSSIGTEAFHNYNGNVDLRNCKSLTSIGADVFKQYKKKTLYLPVSMRTIEANAIYYQTNYSSDKPKVRVAYDNSVVSVNGVYRSSGTGTALITTAFNIQKESSDAVSISQICFDDIALTWNGDGHYFEIADEQDLIDLAEYIRGGSDRYCEGATFKMTADLDFTAMPLNCHDKDVDGTGNFVPIAIDAGDTFWGHFDGDGHSITGLRFSYPINNVGLFCKINSTNATVENVTLVNPNFSAYNGVGGIVGIFRTGTVSNCHVVGGTISGGNQYVGGIVGQSAYSTSADVKTISGCTVVGTTVSGSSKVGAIVGSNTYGTDATAALTISGCTYHNPTGLDVCGYGRDNRYTDGGGNQQVYQASLADGLTASTAAYRYGNDYYFANSATVNLGHTDRMGYVFSGYESSDVDISNGVFTMPAKDVSVSAAWKKLLENTDISVVAIDDQEWTGSGITPAVTVKDGTTDISGECDFAYSDNQNTGIATVTITAKTASTAYSGSTSKTFEIVPKVTNYGAMIISEDQTGKTATLDGDSNEPFKITSNIIVDKVILRRKFVQGVPTTICLPFAFSKANFDNETFSTLNYVDEDKATHQLVAHMTGVNDLQANTPYYFEPSSTTATQEGNNYTEIEFDNVTIVAGNAGSSTSGDWTIVGNYDRVKWTTNTADPLYSSTHAAELGRAYGYAKTTKTVGGVTYQEGQFVKLGDGAHTRAFRAYMLAPATNNSPGLNDLPDTIDVVWHNDDATGVTSMSDGRRQMSDVWYDLSGRKLSGKPTAKGIYINNGRKVVIR